ncbi:MAG TPA: PilZ domain-containing protein [Microvirga sp.]|jgi:hypothetical protein|nr:PilZ domain-containing protein [Microvirga sp.]
MAATATALSLEESPRSDARVRVAWKVKAIVAPGEPEVTCVVLDVSAGGARLSVPRDVHLPDRFSLFLPLRNETHAVEVKWRDADTSELGVAFRAETQGAPAGERTEARFAQLEAHIQHLEEQIRRTDERLASLLDRVTRLEFP